MIDEGENPGKSEFPSVRRQDPGNANREIAVPRGAWLSRGYLPHFECQEVPQHVTFHLADSLPQTVLQQLKRELRSLPVEEREVEQRRRLDDWIDAGQGSCVLRRADIAAMTQASLLTFDSKRYRLIAWVVMPNHVHVLFAPLGDGAWRRSLLRGRSSLHERFVIVSGTTVTTTQALFGIVNIGTVLSAMGGTWCRRLNIFI